MKNGGVMGVVPNRSINGGVKVVGFSQGTIGFFFSFPSSHQLQLPCVKLNNDQKPYVWTDPFADFWHLCDALTVSALLQTASGAVLLLVSNYQTVSFALCLYF